MLMMRALLLCVVFLWGAGSAFTEAPVYWLEFHSGTPSAQNTVDKRFQQLQDQFKIRKVINVQIVEAQSSGGEIKWTPYQVVIFRGQRHDFDRYYSSPVYKELNEIKGARIEVITTFVGNELQANGLEFLEKAPMAALVLSPNQTEPSEASLTLAITEVIASKGALSPFAQKIKQVRVLPLSFDDNPMDFMPVEKSINGLGLIGEIVR